MNVGVSVTVEGDAVTVAALSDMVTNRRGLHAALGSRLEDILVGHFRSRPGEGFWKEVAAATALEEITETSATVVVADRRANVHIYGGTIRPVEKKALTIPVHPMARGKFARELEREQGLELFRPNKKGGGRHDILAANIGGRLVPLYALKKKAVIPRDPQALPPAGDVEAELLEEAKDFLAREVERRAA